MLNGTGATAMTIVIIVIIWRAVIGFSATASRMTWSFARDRGLPFHWIIRKVLTVIPCLLNLIYIGSSTASNDVISMSVSGLYASYLLPCSFLLWRRVTGQIKPHRAREEAVLEWGPWRVPGLLGVLNNTFACIFCVWVLFWDFWPPSTPANAENMNYSVLVTGSVTIFAVARYFLGVKVDYRGPLVGYEVKSFAVGS
ncbi:amino acid/polyamine transporter I [Xylaria sp. FL1042]|nr:amino acid/polyamine transporter I [Xylaria sp. FL1042]